jgi:prepilin-type N-terminal cleavage/methylation domain-containing protein
MKKFMGRMNKKGFTLAELLIVVAIIAVLVAISVPIFSTQLEKSRDSVSIANIRTAYAQAAAAVLTSNGKAVAKTNGVTVAAADNGSQVVTVENVALKGQSNGFSGQEVELSFTHNLSNSSTEGGTAGNYTLEFTYDLASGGCTLTTLTKQN